MVDDFVKVHALLQCNTVLCLAQIALLNAEMTAAAMAPLAPHGVTDERFANPKGKLTYLKLSRALEYYEGYCWFPANRALLSGLLTSAGFEQSMLLGFNKDPGAGRMHGEQSHRIQWHAIMRLMTNNFQTPIHTAAGWKHSPVQLFHSFLIGPGALVPPKGAWGRAMDTQGNPGWGNPDNVVKDILNSQVVLVREALQRRITKMGGPGTHMAVNPTLSARDNAIQTSFLTLHGQGRINVPSEPDPTKLFDKIVLQIYTWEKTSTPIIASGDLAKGAKVVYDDVKKTSAHLFHTDKTYKKVEMNLLTKKDAPDKLVRIDNDLIAKSRKAFDTDYTYLNATGAHAVPTRRW